MLTTNEPRERRGIDPAILALDLQARDIVLQKDRDESEILMGADALVAARRVAAGIADDFSSWWGIGV